MNEHHCNSAARWEKKNALDLWRENVPPWSVFARLSKTTRRTAMGLAALAVFTIAGGHWAVLQSIAWAQMLQEYTELTGSFADGARMTFSGEFPCTMCHAVDEGKSREARSPAVLKTEKKAEIFLTAAADILQCPPAFDFEFPPTVFAGPQRGDPPPGPVPLA